MRFSEINPFIRFASLIYIEGEIPENAVYDCRIFFVLDEPITIYMNEQTIKLNKNSLFYCPFGSKYYISAPKKSKVLSINFDLDQSYRHIRDAINPIPAAEFNPHKLNCTSSIENGEYLNSYVYINDAWKFYDALNEIVTEYSHHIVYFREKSSAVLKQLLVDINRENLFEISTPTNAINHAISFICANYQNKLTNKQIADIIGYHECHLNRLFIKNTGLSLHKYIINYRLNRAKEMLICTNSSIDIIAEKSGFYSISAFSSYFKKEFDMTPSQYRKKYHNKL